MVVTRGIYPTEHHHISFAYASWSLDFKVMIVEGEPGEAWEDQEHRGRGTKVMVVEGQPREDQGDYG